MLSKILRLLKSWPEHFASAVCARAWGRRVSGRCSATALRPEVFWQRLPGPTALLTAALVAAVTAPFHQPATGGPVLEWAPRPGGPDLGTALRFSPHLGS